MWINEELYGLNASGSAPASISIEALRAMGIKEMPARGFVPVYGPRCPECVGRTVKTLWAAIVKRSAAACYFVCTRRVPNLSDFRVQLGTSV